MVLLQNSVEKFYILVTKKNIFNQRWVGMRSNTNKQGWESRCHLQLVYDLSCTDSAGLESNINMIFFFKGKSFIISDL